jgi:putative membrane protein
MMWDWYGPGAGWEGWAMIVFMIVFVVAAVIAVVFFVRYFAQSQPPQQQIAPTQVAQPMVTPPTPAAESPKDILKRRYAAGEIDRDEYLQKLGDL